MKYLQICYCGKCSGSGDAALEGSMVWRCADCYHFATGEEPVLIPLPEKSKVK